LDNTPQAKRGRRICNNGLFVSLHIVMADDPDRRVPGIPFHLVPRILLETCRSVASRC